MSVFNDIEWTKKGNTDVCLHNARKVAANALQFKPRHWCFLGSASETTWWNGNFNGPCGKCDILVLQIVDIFTCHTSHPIFPATEPLSLGLLRKGGSNYHFQSTFDNKKILTKKTVASNSLCIYSRFCQWYETEIQVPTHRRAEEEEQIDLDPEQLTLIAQKQRKMPQARGDSLLRFTENRWTLIRRASARTVVNGQSPLNLFWKETAPLPHAENTQTQVILIF